jgi:hypothetical protein
VGLMERAVIGGERVGRICGVLEGGVVGRWGWDVESPHILTASFRAN